MSHTTNNRILVWGACGFIGQSLVSSLVAAGANVGVLTRKRTSYPPPPWENQVRWFELDGVNDGEVIRRSLEDAKVIYNLAGSSGAVASNRKPLESLDANCRIQLQFLEACAEARTHPHVVFASSRLVYGAPTCLPVDESCPTAPVSMYAAHKLAVEHYHRIFATVRDAITYTICRISNPFGIEIGAGRKSYGVINSMIENALEGRPITLFGDGRQIRDYLYIDDLIEALRLCGTHASAQNQVFNVGVGKGVSMVEAASLIQEIAGRGVIRFEPWPEEYLSVESGDFVADIKKIERLLRFSPRYDLVAGLRIGISRQMASSSPYLVRPQNVSYATTS